MDDLEGIMLSEISQTQKDKHHMISFICGINNNNKLTETGVCQRQGVSKKHKLPFIKTFTVLPI